MSNDPLGTHPFVERFGQQWTPETWASARLLLAVSGGPDSVALLRAVRQLAIEDRAEVEIHVAHFNHRWRGQASDAHQQFVVQLCGEQDLPVHFQQSARPEKKEESARLERYAFLQATAQRLQARYVLLGHNANDQAETILHRILRGTALRGLAGMPLTRPLGTAQIQRPMLWATRQEVLEFLTDIGQAYCEDDSNLDVRYMRNRIRSELLPLLADRYNPGVIQSLLRLGDVAREVQQYLADQVQAELPRCILYDEANVVELDRARMLELPVPIRKQLLVSLWQRQGWSEQSMGFEQWNRLEDAIQNRQKVCCPGGVVVETVREHVRLTRRCSDSEYRNSD